jgi:hypothetical protein
MDHKNYIENYKGNLKELAEDIGNLKYDALADFLRLLSEKIKKDGEKDKLRGRIKLSTSLFNCSEKIGQSAENIDKAWEISEPYFKH